MKTRCSDAYTHSLSLSAPRRRAPHRLTQSHAIHFPSPVSGVSGNALHGSSPHSVRLSHVLCGVVLACREPSPSPPSPLTLTAPRTPRRHRGKGGPRAGLWHLKTDSGNFSKKIPRREIFWPKIPPLLTKVRASPGQDAPPTVSKNR